MEFLLRASPAQLRRLRENRSFIRRALRQIITRQVHVWPSSDALTRFFIPVPTLVQTFLSEVGVMSRQFSFTHSKHISREPRGPIAAQPFGRARQAGQIECCPFSFTRTRCSSSCSMEELVMIFPCQRCGVGANSEILYHRNLKRVVVSCNLVRSMAPRHILPRSTVCFSVPYYRLRKEIRNC